MKSDLSIKELAKLCRDLVQSSSKSLHDAFYKQDHEFEIKKDKSIVTSLDKSTEKLYRAKIKSRFSTHSIIGEEYNKVQGVSDYTWYLDPIDGTTNFTYGLPLFCSQVAVTNKDQLVATAVHSPITGKTYWTTKDSGAYCDDTVIKNSGELSIDRITLHAEYGHVDEGFQKFNSFLGKHGNSFRSVRRFGTMIGSIQYLGSGFLNCFFMFGVEPHDAIPLAFLSKNTGLNATNIEGSDYNFKKDTDLIVTHPSITKKIVEILRQ